MCRLPGGVGGVRDRPGRWERKCHPGTKAEASSGAQGEEGECRRCCVRYQCWCISAWCFLITTRVILKCVCLLCGVGGVWLCRWLRHRFSRATQWIRQRTSMLLTARRSPSRVHIPARSVRGSRGIRRQPQSGWRLRRNLQRDQRRRSWPRRSASSRTLHFRRPCRRARRETNSDLRLRIRRRHSSV